MKVYLRRKGVALVDYPEGILLVGTSNRKFMLPGGGANSGESWKDATIRELYEETGLHTAHITYLFSHLGAPWKARNGRMIRNAIKVFKVTPSGRPRPNNEISHLAFWKPGSRLYLRSTSQHILDAYLASKNQLRA